VAIGAGTLQATADIVSARQVAVNNANSRIAVDPGKTYTLNTGVTGTGSLNKTGAGTLVLGAAANTYAGATVVQAGTLDLHGSISGDVDIFSNATFKVDGLTNQTFVVASGRTLGTTGSEPANAAGSLEVNIGGNLNPGGTGAIGNLNVTGSLTLDTGATLFADFGAGGHDSITAAGVDLGNHAILTLSPIGGFSTYGDGSTFALIDNTGSPVTGSFATTSMSFGPDAFNNQTFNVVQATDGEYFAVSYNGDAMTGAFSGGNDVVLMAVPEPSSVGSLLIGLASLTGLQRFRRRNRGRQS
jgi:autotransporter-associated beta strand protein